MHSPQASSTQGVVIDGHEDSLCQEECESSALLIRSQHASDLQEVEHAASQSLTATTDITWGLYSGITGNKIAYHAWGTPPCIVSV